MKNIQAENVKIKDGFWRFYMDLNRNAIVKNVYERFRETGRFDALSCNWREGMENKPHMFWDSDVAKWIEGAAYIIQEAPDPELEKRIDAMIDAIAANQRADGYYNSYFLTVEPSKIFTCRDWHELYCLGHAIEAAIAYHKATGKDKYLTCILKYVDMVYRVFVEEKSAAFFTPGHEEIELALLRLYAHLGDPKHLELARYFINERGKNKQEIIDRDGNADLSSKQRQDQCPVREMDEAVGHAVAAGYLYTAMKMLANVDGDKELEAACDRLFDNIVNRKMSITGGVGSDSYMERFTYEYNLPNTSTYNETCAAIALALFAEAMQEGKIQSTYGDVIERVLYNGFISGVSLDGEKFFYANPLELDIKKYGHSAFQPVGERQKLFRCSCCPPNVVRTLGSVARYLYTVDGDTIYCNQFAASEARLQIGGKEAVLEQITNYPFDGKITFVYHGAKANLCVRIPAWCVEYEGETENGFAKFSLCDGDTVTLDLPMAVHFIEANPRLQDNSGRYAVQRGPIVYCMEGLDNGENLRDITLLENGAVKVVTETGIPAPVIYMDACHRAATEHLYYLKHDTCQRFTARLIPYFSFANRSLTDMLIWAMVK